MSVEMLDKELEDQLKEVGGKLAKLPSTVEGLLALLDEVEECLSKVEQSPSKSMQNALSPSMKALVVSDLLRHKDTDVRVYVASCISEITRVTAPDAPYTDNQMKQIFQIIVESFEMLWDASSRSFNKRISILETLAKVRSCVVMLDLECDGLILEMFQHFFKALRSHHPESVFTSMETIMSLVIKESEEIAPELLHPLLASVKKENQDSLPIIRKLGERVLENCSSNLKAYLLPAVKSMGMSPSDFSKIVASICLDASDMTKINSGSASGEDLTDKSSPENTSSDRPPQVPDELRSESAFPSKVDVASEKSAGRNSDAQHVNDNPEVFNDSSKKEEFSLPSPKLAPPKPDNLDPKVDEAETKPDQPPKRKRGRPKASLGLNEESTPLPSQRKSHGKASLGLNEESTPLPSQRKSHGKGYAKSLSEESIDNSVLPSGPKEEAVAEVSSLPVSQNATVTVVSPSTSQGLTDKGPRKRGRPLGSKNGTTAKVAPKEAPSIEQVELDVPPSTDTVSERGPEGEIEVKVKPNRRAGKEGRLEKENEEKSSDAASDLEKKPLRKSRKKVDTTSINQESSEKIQAEKTEKERSNNVTEKGLPEESGKKKTVATMKSKENSTSKNKKHAIETPRTTSKRKQTPAKEEISQKASDEDLGENLVGSKIKVWWPDDNAFYEGTIDSFDLATRKHKVSYVDGDVEILLLKEERWEAIDEFTMQDEGQTPILSTPKASSEMPKKKKAKTDSGSTSKKAKVVESQIKGASTSKTKEDSLKSSRKSKKDTKLDNNAGDEISKNSSISKSKGNAPKTASKAKDDTPLTVTKENDETPKVSTKIKGIASPKTGKSKAGKPKTGSNTKDATQQTEATSEDDISKKRQKSKSVTPKTGNKLGANGTSKGRSDTSKVQETEEGGKAELSELAKAEENETKSGKKRRRVNA